MSGDPKKSSYRARQRGFVPKHLDEMTAEMAQHPSATFDTLTPSLQEVVRGRATLKANDAMRLALEARTRP